MTHATMGIAPIKPWRFWNSRDGKGSHGPSHQVLSEDFRDEAGWMERHNEITAPVTPATATDWDELPGSLEFAD